MAVKESGNSSGTGRILAVVFGGLGLFVLAAGLYFGYESWDFTQEGRSLSGIVVDFHESMDEDQQLRYAPVVEYQIDGRPYRFVGVAEANSPAYRIGEELPVLVDPAAPDRARLNLWGTLWGIPAALTAVGLILLIVSLAGLRRT